VIGAMETIVHLIAELGQALVPPQELLVGVAVRRLQGRRVTGVGIVLGGCQRRDITRIGIVLGRRQRRGITGIRVALGRRQRRRIARVGMILRRRQGGRITGINPGLHLIRRDGAGSNHLRVGVGVGISQR